MAFPKKILVSRNLSGDSNLREWATRHGHALIEAPFIRIDPILHLDIPLSDWIFFSSPNGVDVYFDNYPILANKIAVFGAGTHHKLTSRGIEANFIGDNRKTPAEIGKDFFDFIDPNAVVVFPVSQLSQKSIIKVNNSNKCYELVIYNTQIEANKMPKMDIVILSSPSNIDGYLIENPIENTEFIVLGETSRRYFESLNLNAKVNMTASSSEAGVIELLEQLLNYR